MHGNEVFQRVRDALAQVEAERNVRVLFACESVARLAPIATGRGAVTA